MAKGLTIYLNFYDGTRLKNDTIDFGNYRKEGKGDFLELIIKGIQNNADITMRTPEGTIVKKFEELKSIELVVEK